MAQLPTHDLKSRYGIDWQDLGRTKSDENTWQSDFKMGESTYIRYIISKHFPEHIGGSFGWSIYFIGLSDYILLTGGEMYENFESAEDRLVGASLRFSKAWSDLAIAHKEFNEACLLPADAV